MLIIPTLVFALWAAFWLYWLAAWIYDRTSSKYKPAEKSRQSVNSARSYWGTRIAIAVAVILLIAFGRTSLFSAPLHKNSLIVSEIGVLVIAISLLFAIWARIHLSSNWSDIILLRKGQTLVKTGPYSILRHPIYTGLIFAGIGTLLALGSLLSLFVVIVLVTFCMNRVRVEEKLMAGKFGKQYRTYQKETKKVIPFVY